MPLAANTVPTNEPLVTDRASTVTPKCFFASWCTCNCPQNISGSVGFSE